MAVWMKNALGVFSFLLGLLSMSEAKAESSELELPGGPDGYNGVTAQAKKLSGILGLSESDGRLVERLFLVQSYSESRGNRSAANKTQSESAAAKNLYFARGNNQKLQASVGKFPDEDWYFPGSGGWFGLMPVTLLNVVGGKDARGLNLGPRSNYDAWASTVMYAAYLSRLVRRSEWGRSTQDAYALKAGGAAGSLMDDPEKERYQKAAGNLDKAVQSLGLPSGFGSTPVPAQRIFGGRDWLAVYIEGMN